MDKLSDYNYVLPEHLIAQHPLHKRSGSRLLVLTKDANAPLHTQFLDIIEFLNPGDALVVNDTKVIKARLFGNKQTGGHVELLLSRLEDLNTWICLIQTKRKLLLPTTLYFEGKSGKLTATVHSRVSDEPGAYRVEFHGDVVKFSIENGELPLPSYIEHKPTQDDEIRYQNVFADDNKAQAVAAPTAGLHFDEEILAQIEAKGVHLVKVTLHVGPGTFLPIRHENLDEHKMHAEPWSISAQAADVLNNVRKRGGRIIAVGTTSVRVLESALKNAATFSESCGLTRLFIRPGFQFRAVNALITNFHFPKTTLLMLVSAIAGRERVLAAYNDAVKLQYRFFSYGDSCYFENVNPIL